MKAITPTTLLSIFLIGTAAAGSPTPAPTSEAAAPEADAFSSQSLIGAPYIRFGRRYSDTELPGYPVGGISYSHTFSSNFDSLPGDFSADKVSAFVPILPVNLENFHLIAFGLYSADRLNTTTPTPATNLISEDTLHSFKLPVVFLHDVSQQWIWGGAIIPGYSGTNSSGDNWNFAAALGAGYAFNDQFLLFAGGYYSYSLNDHFAIPGIAFIWRPTDKMEVLLLGPWGGVSYQATKRLKLSAGGEWESPGWHIGADSFGPARDLEYTSLRLGLTAEYQLGGVFWGSITGGYSVLQNVKIEDTSNNSLLDQDVDPAPFVEAAITIRF